MLLTEKYFIDRVEVDSKTGCWNWQLMLSRWYGKCSLNIWEWKKTYRVHRLSYEFFKWEIPKDMCVCHTCDNPKCCNPKHLWLWTVKDNVEDMHKKWRYVIWPAHKQFWNKNSAKNKIRIGDKIFDSMVDAANYVWISDNWLKKRIKKWGYDYEIIPR